MNLAKNNHTRFLTEKIKLLISYVNRFETGFSNFIAITTIIFGVFDKLRV